MKDAFSVFLPTLLSDVKEGVIQFPDYQHGIVSWGVSQQLDLLDSAYRGIPIGSVLLWQTNQKLLTRTRIGSHLVSANKIGAPYQYLLDGFQRLAFFLGTLYEPDVVSSERAHPGSPAVYFDLQDCRFEVQEEGPIPSHWIPLSTPLSTVKLLRFQRQLACSGLPDIWATRADELATKLRSCKVTVLTLSTEDRELAETASKRANNYRPFSLATA